MGYSSDRAFTDYVHKNLAIPIIYEPLCWLTPDMNKTLLNNVDILNAVDVFLIDFNNKKIITAQERFREVKYKNNSDFTIRYERKFNTHEDRRKSEYFKLNADVFVYGIINTTKENVSLATGFIKYAIIDITKLKQLIDAELIIIDETLKSTKCVEKNGKIFCPVIYNSDNSSSFIPIDIKLLLKLFLKYNVVLKNVGF